MMVHSQDREFSVGGMIAPPSSMHYWRDISPRVCATLSVFGQVPMLRCHEDGEHSLNTGAMPNESL